MHFYVTFTTFGNQENMCNMMLKSKEMHSICVKELQVKMKKPKHFENKAYISENLFN